MTQQVIFDALETVRDLLDMDTSYISEAVGNDIAFRHVSSDPPHHLVQPGVIQLCADTYCGHIASGALPSMIPDTEHYPLARESKFIRDAQIRSLICVPINRSDGSIYGMFCCFSRSPKPGLNERDLKTVTLFAGLAAKSLNQHIDTAAEKQKAVTEIRNVISEDRIETYFQPIVSLSSRMPMAVEALSRFNDEKAQGPLEWFNLASQADMSLELELAAIRVALRYLPQLPEKMYLTLNASPATLKSSKLFELLTDTPPDRVVLELTEHDFIGDISELSKALDVYRARRIGIAIDDLGAGYSGLSTVLGLNAHVLKLDRGLVSDIHKDPAKQSLTQAMVYFAETTSAFLIAEGVEKEEEHEVLVKLGVRLGQGFLYARPGPAQDQLKTLHVQRTGRPVKPALRSLKPQMS